MGSVCCCCYSTTISTYELGRQTGTPVTISAVTVSEREVVVLHELENNPCIVRAFLSEQEPRHGGVASITAVVRYTLFLYVFVDGVENASQGHGPGHFASGEVK